MEFLDIDFFQGFFSTYYPRPFLTRPNAPITTGTVSIVLLSVIILLLLLLLLLLLFHFTLIITSTVLQKSLPGGLFISSTFEEEGLNREWGGGLFEWRA